ncbi:MAG TPA: UvrD-helicase domain-containing protein [Kofleriaceae bacterium]|nr:UvrD-helicase domain-containing protein [Kofleriaceae bacterium]
MTVVRFPRPEALPAAGERFVVVEASAGTGKTFFLEHRVADLILAGVPLGEILLVTFTDKAVAELRVRVRDLLDRMARATTSCADASAWQLDDAARVRLRAAIGAFDHAQIFTIHGFCHRVLVEDAFAARRLFDQRQVADEDAFADAFAALLRERFATEAPDRDLLALYLEAEQPEHTVDTLRTLLLACARSGGVPRRRFDPARSLALADALAARFGTSELRARVLAQISRQKHNAARWLEQLADALAVIDPVRPTTVLAACDALREPARKLLDYLPASEAAAVLRDACGELSLDEAIAAELLPHVIARVGADKAERGLYDYDDMLRLVRDAVVGAGTAPSGRELAARLRARTPWAMIDEFQDTDPVQWDIFRTVWMHDEASGLCIVGDPKQAIYGFRGADVQTYVQARDELVRTGAARVVLAVNRRSTAPLVEAVNELLAGGAPLATPLLSGSIAYDHPVDASGDIEHDGTRPPVTVFALHGAGREPNREALAGAIGAEIERLRASPPAWRVRGELRPFALGQCLVLTRTNKESAAIAAALRARGLPCELREADHLFETREAHELAAVLAAVAAPRDRSARMRALRTRFFDVPWAELMTVVDAPDHHPLIARLYDWAGLAGHRAYEVLFRRLVEDSRYSERALVLGGGERALVNTWHLIELLSEEVARSRGDLHELVAQLRRWIADGMPHVDDRDVQRVETDGDAVRVLTIHKAKGLEAPYVFVFGCASPPPSTPVVALRDTAAGRGRALVVGRTDEAVAARVDAEVDGEHERLAYVALTRAQVRLYLPLYGENVLKGRSMYEPIQRCLRPLAARPHPRLEVIDVAVGVPSAPLAPPDALADLDVPPPPAPAALAAIAGARAGLATVSYTRIAHAHGDARAGSPALAIDPAELNADDDRDRRDLRVAPGELPPGADTGLFLHDVLELADVDGVRRAPDAAAWAETARDLLVDRARARGIDSAYLPHAARVVYDTLTQPLRVANGDALPPLVQSRALAREVEFAYPIAGEPCRALVRGFIDALAVWDDELWVVDYKSDVLEGADLARAAADRVEERYAAQLKLYALAAARVRGARPLAGLVFAFVRYGIAVTVRTSDDQLAAWTRWLAELPLEAG